MIFIDDVNKCAELNSKQQHSSVDLSLRDEGNRSIIGVNTRALIIAGLSTERWRSAAWYSCRCSYQLLTIHQWDQSVYVWSRAEAKGEV